MFYTKTGLPEESELVMCKVTSVQYNSVFVNMLEYDLSGMIHISEVSPGRIRNIRDYVKEGKVVVCKVLRINRERQQIDLSLRRVSDFQRREKVNEIKQEQMAEKIVEFAAERIKKPTKDVYQEIVEKISDEYESLYSYFEEVMEDDSLLKDKGIDPKIGELILPLIKQRIKPPEVNISGQFQLKSYEPDGVETIKDALRLVMEKGGERFTLTYAGAGAYNFSIVDREYKSAEKTFEALKTCIESYLQEHKGELKIIRSKE
ncbi:MAG: S1 RNA-binding domain-containing protein [archaeon]